MDDHKIQLVAVLRALLKQAKSGQIRGLAYCEVDDNGDFSSQIVGGFSTLEVIGATSHLHYTAMLRVHEDADYNA